MAKIGDVEASVVLLEGDAIVDSIDKVSSDISVLLEVLTCLYSHVLASYGRCCNPQRRSKECITQSSIMLVGKCSRWEGKEEGYV